MPQRIAVCCAFVVALGACASKQASPPAAPAAVVEAPAIAAEPTAAEPTTDAPLTDAEFEAMMVNALAMFNAMGDAGDASGGDCDKLAAGLEQVLADNTAFIAEARKHKDNPELDRKGEVWMRAHQDEVVVPMRKVAVAGQSCVSNERFMAVMEKLGELGD